MKKFFYLSALSLGMMCSITACSDDDTTTIDAKNLPLPGKIAARQTVIRVILFRTYIKQYIWNYTKCSTRNSKPNIRAANGLFEHNVICCKSNNREKSWRRKL